MPIPHLHQISVDPRASWLKAMDDQIRHWASTGRLFDTDDLEVNRLLDERDTLFRQINPHLTDPLRFLEESWEEDDA